MSPSPVMVEENPAARSSVLTRQVLASLAALTALRLVCAGSVELASDEAYYWSWSRHLSLSYLDHPPLLAWLLSPLSSLSAGKPLLVRLVPVFSTTMALLVLSMCGTQRRPGVEGEGWGALPLLGVGLSPALALGGCLSTPDAPLLVCWCASVVFLSELGSPNCHGIRRHKILCGLFVVVLMGMLSKLSMLLLLPSVIVGVTASGLSLRRDVWLTILVGVSLSVPVYAVGWGEGHMLAFQSMRVSGRAVWDLMRPLEMLLGVLGLLTPLLGGGVLWVAFFGWRSESRRQRFLWGLSVTPLALVLGSSVYVSVELNWLMISWPAALLVLVRRSATWKRRRAFWGGVLVTGLAVTSVFLASVFVSSERGAAPSGLERVHGWERWCGAVVEGVEGEVVYVTPRYQEASQLAFWRGVPVTTLRALREAGGPWVEDKGRRQSAWREMSEWRQGSRLVLLLERDGRDIETVLKKAGGYRVVRQETIEGPPAGPEEMWRLLLER